MFYGVFLIPKPLTMHKLLICVSLIFMTCSSYSQLAYFQSANQLDMLDKAELCDDLDVKLVISTGLDLSQFDYILIRTYGKKRENSNYRLIGGKYLSSTQLLEKHALDGVYYLSFLKRSDTKAWISDLELEKYGVKGNNYVRATVLGIKKVGNRFVESQLMTSDWLNVKDIKRSFPNSNNSLLGPAFAGVLTATFIAIPFLME